MFTVKTPEEAFSVIETEFHPSIPAETVPLSAGCGRILAEDIISAEYDYNMEYLISVDFSNFYSYSVTSMNYLFKGCYSLESIEEDGFIGFIKNKQLASLLHIY